MLILYQSVECSDRDEIITATTMGMLLTGSPKLVAIACQILSVKIVFLIVDNSLQILEVDVTVNNNHSVGHFTGISDDDFA